MNDVYCPQHLSPTEKGHFSFPRLHLANSSKCPGSNWPAPVTLGRSLPALGLFFY